MQRNYDGYRGAIKFGAALVFLAFASLSTASVQSPPCCVTIDSTSQVDVYVTLSMDPYNGGGAYMYSYLLANFAMYDPIAKKPGPANYAAWCFDSRTPITPSATYTGRLYSYCDNPFGFEYSRWQAVNYLISKRQLPNVLPWLPCGVQLIRPSDMQWAIWRVLGVPAPLSSFPLPDEALVECLVKAAQDAVLAGWTPGLGDKVAVIFDAAQNPDPSQSNVQLIFLEVPCTKETPPCDVSVKLECLVPATPPTTPFDCSGAKPIDTLWVRWNGAGAVYVKAWNGSVGTGTPQTFGPVAVGQVVKFTRAGTFPNDVYFELFSKLEMAAQDKVGLSTFHLSCSDDDMDGPEDCGKAAGNGKTTLSTYTNMWVFEGMGGNGTSFGCTPIPPEASTSCSVVVKPMASCDTLGKPTSLTFRYTGGGCGGNNPQSGKFICSGSVNTALPVTVSSANGYTISPTVVAPGGEFTVSASSFNAQSLFTLTNAGGTQSLSIHTSCSQPLAVGDVYGNLTLVGFNGQMGGTPISLRYTVKNESPAVLHNVYLTDSKLGAIGGPFTLTGNETKVFVIDLQVNGALSSVATVTVQGQPCSAVSNQVVVNVLASCPAPVPGSSSGVVCSDIKPIDSISMQWDGAQAIGVKAWKGAVGSSTLLATIASVSPGQLVTVSGYAGSPNDVYWEIFSGDVNGARLGESTFHLSCSDSDMNGPEDCGKAQGDGKGRLGFINQWIFKGMSGNGKVIDCTGAQPLVKATIKDKKLLWTLSNSGPMNALLSKVTASWPASNGRLLKVKLDGDVIWDDKSAAGATSISLEDAVFTNEAKKKSINAGDTRVFTLEFERDASPNLSDYTLSLAFGSCVLNL